MQKGYRIVFPDVKAGSSKRPANKPKPGMVVLHRAAFVGRPAGTGHAVAIRSEALAILDVYGKYRPDPTP